MQNNQNQLQQNLDLDFLEDNNFNNTNIKEAINKMIKLIDPSKEVFYDGFSSEQIWYQLKPLIDKQIKNIDKANQEYQKNMDIEDQSILEEDLSQEQESLQDQEIENEELDQNDKQKNNQNENQNSEEEYNENFDQFEDYMEKIDEEGLKALENDAEDYNEMAIMEENEEQVNESEQDENKDDQNEFEEEEQDPDEDMEDVFQQIEQGTYEQNMEKLEQNLINQKPWQQRGEIRGLDRDMNGLVEEELEFDRGLRMEKQIDENKNKSFEDIIKQRILDLTFDNRNHLEYKKRQQQKSKQVKEFPELNFEKDQRGLGGLYEDEYKQKVLGVDDKKSKDDIKKIKITELYKAICYSIDSMSRLNFNPGDNKLLKDNKADDQFIIEEKVPLVVKVQKQQTYNELNNPLKKDLQTKEEMTQQDKKKLRRKIKLTFNKNLFAQNSQCNLKTYPKNQLQKILIQNQNLNHEKKIFYQQLMLYRKVLEFFQEDNKFEAKDFQKFSKKNKKILAREINKLQLQLSQKKLTWQNFEWNKLDEHVERSLMDLELTKNESIQINKMIYKLKAKKNKKIVKDERQRLLKDFNDSLILNKQQWRAITNFLQNLISNLEMKFQQTELHYAKSKKLNLNLLEEIQRLEHKLVMQRKSRNPIDLSSNSIFQKENSLNFNDISSCYSESRQTFSEISKPFSNHNHSWLLQNNERQNEKFSSSHTDFFQQELLLNEKENHQNDSQQKLKSIGDSSGFGFLVPDEEKLGKIMNTKISQKQLLNLSNKDDKLHNNFLIKNENISSFSLNKQHSNRQKI